MKALEVRNLRLDLQRAEQLAEGNASATSLHGQPMMHTPRLQVSCHPHAILSTEAVRIDSASPEEGVTRH